MSKLDLTLLGACGLHCSECEVYVAFSEGDSEKREEIAASISRQFDTEIGPEQIMCGGCRGPMELSFCAGCRIRPCAEKKGYVTCAECEEMDACETLWSFLRTDPGRLARRGLAGIRELGLDVWLERKAGK
jgi:hypothetical protein